MQNTFCAVDLPAEVPASRDIVPNINSLTPKLRVLGVPVIWVIHANTQHGGKSDWELFYNYFVTGSTRERTLVSNSPNNQAVYSSFRSVIRILLSSRTVIARSFLEHLLLSVMGNLGIDHILIAGTKTNVCCESSACDAMMLDFKVTMLSDCCAALSDDEHLASLEVIIQQFGNVMTSTEALDLLQNGAR